MRRAVTAMLPVPGFHHLHLNSVDPEASIALGDTRAVMVEGPSREAIELVEIA